MPWTDEPEGDDEAIPPTVANSDSSDDDHVGKCCAEYMLHVAHPHELMHMHCAAHPLASSIHTIHRPIARSRRQDSVHFDTAGRLKGKGTLQLIESSDDEEPDSVSDDDEDFETTPIDMRNAAGSSVNPLNEADTTSKRTPLELAEGLAQSRRLMMTRSASLATVRIKRRARLAEKLRDVFGLNDISEVVAGDRHLNK